MTLDRNEKRLRRIARRLTWFDLQAPDADEEGITSAEVLEELLRKTPARTFLDYYTRAGLEEALKRYGTWGRFEALGLRPCLAVLHPDPHRHLLRLTDGPDGPPFFELLARFAPLRARVSLGNVRVGDVLDLIAIEWLLMQHPGRAFTRERPRLPGQKFPGLGIGAEVMTLLGIMCERLGREGLIGLPEHFHNAVLYAGPYRFFSPRREGEFAALRRDTAALGLAAASWAVETGLVREARSGAPYAWTGEEMIRPFSPRMTGYFAAPEYAAEAERVREERRFTVDAAAAARAVPGDASLPR